MPSRKKRKRYRRMMAEATVSPTSAGGWGKDAPVSRGDLLLLRHAIAQGWEISPQVRSEIVDRIHAVFGDPEPRMKMAAVYAVLAMERENIQLAPATAQPYSHWPTDVALPLNVLEC